MNSHTFYIQTFTSETSHQLVEILDSIDFKSLSLEEHNLDYIEKMKPNFFYYIQMFDYAINTLIKDDDIDNKWIIDFGGGHGFLSLFLKLKGFRVIYCDFNINSVQTIKKIAEHIGFGPDYYVHGSSSDVLAFINEKDLNIDYLISTDTIEHIFDLEEMFYNFHLINSSLNMLFTTASNPKNFIKAKQLRKLMNKDEIEENIPNRRKFLAENYHDLTDEELNNLANNSRGLRYVDLPEYVKFYEENRSFKKIEIDAYNCCEPEFGSWMERILPLEDYIDLGKKYDYNLEIKNGFYNYLDKKSVKKILVEQINNFMVCNKAFGIYLAPFITLKYSK